MLTLKRCAQYFPALLVFVLGHSNCACAEAADRDYS